VKLGYAEQFSSRNLEEVGIFASIMCDIPIKSVYSTSTSASPTRTSACP